MPLYNSARSAPVPVEPTDHQFRIPIGTYHVSGRLWRSRLPDSEVPVYLVEQPGYFGRDDPAAGFGLYQYKLPAGGALVDYEDNAARFIFFCRAVLEAVPALDFRPDVLHLNDWQTALIPAYWREMYASRPGYDSMGTLYTIHNLAYQGVFDPSVMPLTGFDWRLFNWQELEFHDRLNFMKAGIVFADLLSTVSPRYAVEIQTPEYGCLLDDVLRHHQDRLVGIVNGVDYQVWNPLQDSHLAANYDAATVAEGKAACKAALQRRLGLPERPGTPLVVTISRLTEQKGFDLIRASAAEWLGGDVQFAVLGVGDAVYHRFLGDLARRYPENVAAVLAFDEVLAHQMEAGGDLFLMPSRFEPSGLNQLYSLRYGTVPLVRATGGLADTVVDCTPKALADGTATGFVFAEYTAPALLATLHRALWVYRSQPETWRRLQRTGMQQDWSWDRRAVDYEALYQRMTLKG